MHHHRARPLIVLLLFAEYNLRPEERYGVKNTFLVVGKQLTYRGFIIGGKDLGNFYTEVPKWVASGEIK